MVGTDARVAPALLVDRTHSCLHSFEEPIMSPRRRRDYYRDQPFNLWVPIAATCGMILLWFFG